MTRIGGLPRTKGVEAPYRSSPIAVFLYNTAGQAITTSATLQWDTLGLDNLIGISETLIGGVDNGHYQMWSSGDPTKVTVPANGWYFISHWRRQTTSGVTYQKTSLKVNGSTVTDSTWATGFHTESSEIGHHWLHYLSAGDVITFDLNIGSGNTRTMNHWLSCMMIAQDPLSVIAYSNALDGTANVDQIMIWDTVQFTRGRWIIPGTTRVYHPRGSGWALLAWNCLESTATSGGTVNTAWYQNGVFAHGRNRSSAGVADSPQESHAGLVHYFDGPGDYIEIAANASKAKGLSGYLRAIDLTPARSLTPTFGVQRPEDAIWVSTTSDSFTLDSNQPIEWDTVVKNGNFGWEKANPSRIYVKATGWYLIDLGVRWGSPNTNRKLISVAVSGNLAAWFERYKATTVYSGGMHHIVPYWVRRGDYLQAYVHTDASSPTVTGEMKIIRIG